jgi:uncharacterized YigZ family protein
MVRTIFFEPGDTEAGVFSAARAEICVKKSRFIAEIFRVTSPEEARAKIKAQKARYADATHVVHAFVAGKKGETRGMSDDGEPAGTSARPVMDTLLGNGRTNILLTVTRYFGGTLLGTGGLVKAYGDAAKAVCALCEFVPVCEKIPVAIRAPYDCFERCSRVLRDLGARYESAFESDVEIFCEIEESQIDLLVKTVADATAGRGVVTRPEGRPPSA